MKDGLRAKAEEEKDPRQASQGTGGGEGRGQDKKKGKSKKDCQNGVRVRVNRRRTEKPTRRIAETTNETVKK